jgi:YegS/Rv2252/BmrU family lipid kinase
MKSETSKLKLLFIVNPASGVQDMDFAEVIQTHLTEKDVDFDIYELPKDCSKEKIKTVIKNARPDRVAAVGGDGTLKLVAECLLNTDMPIAVIPAGSANGMAKELGIPTDILEALDLVVNGSPKSIHAILVNQELCIHLADIGFNAYLVKKFDDLPQRGMRGYAKATWQALWSHHKMEVSFKIKGEEIRSEAAMVVLANATMYGTGVKINPEGDLEDDLFEVILVKKYAVMEILKIWLTRLPFNPNKIESFQATSVNIKTKHQAHFQVDGEYMGKTNKIQAEIIPQAIRIICNI